MKAGIVTFPGSNCDHDAYAVFKHVLKTDVTFLWHKDSDVQDCDLIILPGGFSYGDYLRCGAIARFSPIMNAVVRFAQSGGLVLGICNGFQVLTECGLLPGALIRNRQLRFSCRQVHLRVERTDTPFTHVCRTGDVLMMPIAHGEGNYYHFSGDVQKLEDSGQVLFRYVDPQGTVTDSANPNGSINNIAGICNSRRNVAGLMPHPERAVETVLGSTDGLRLFESVQAWLKAAPARVAV